VPAATIMFAASNDNATMTASEMFDHLMLLGVQLVRGDVVNLSLGVAAPAFAPNATVPVETKRLLVSALRLLTMRGIICVVAAGNGPIDLDTAGVSLTRSGAIVVGAIQPSNPPATTFDIHVVSNHGSRVDCCSWGSEFQALVVTPVGGGATSAMQVGVQGGTSFATAIISGLVAAIQGRASAATGSPLTPQQVLALLQDPAMGNDVVPGGGVGLQPDLAAIIPTL
jgi:subtilisin family serine protease